MIDQLCNDLSTRTAGHPLSAALVCAVRRQLNSIPTSVANTARYCEHTSTKDTLTATFAYTKSVSTAIVARFKNRPGLAIPVFNYEYITVTCYGEGRNFTQRSNKPPGDTVKTIDDLTGLPTEIYSTAKE